MVDGGRRMGHGFNEFAQILTRGIPQAEESRMGFHNGWIVYFLVLLSPTGSYPVLLSPTGEFWVWEFS